eukprot:6257903-Amphidinium_carterae.1
MWSDSVLSTASCGLPKRLIVEVPAHCQEQQLQKHTVLPTKGAWQYWKGRNILLPPMKPIRQHGSCPIHSSEVISLHLQLEARSRGSISTDFSPLESRKMQ